MYLMLMSTNAYIAKVIVHTMTTKNITVKALSDKTGLATGTISNIRNAKNHYSWQLKVICDELQLPFSSLFNENITPKHVVTIAKVSKVSNPEILELINRLIQITSK